MSSGPFQPRGRISPTPLAGPGNTTAETHLLVQSLHLTITLWVIPRGEADRDPQTFHKHLPHSGCELGTPIRNDVLRHPVVPEDVGEQSFCRAVGRPGNGIRRQDLENRSTTTRIVMFP